ncbi:hypothetical protein [Bradyrhizobium sp. USDA 4529]
MAYYVGLGVKVERIMADNGACYKSFALRRTCKRLDLKHMQEISEKIVRSLEISAKGNKVHFFNGAKLQGKKAPAG